MADYTKDQGEALVWTLLDDTATDNPHVTTGDETVTAGALSWLLRIVVAHIDTNDAATSYVKVIVSTRAGADASRYRELVSAQAGGGQSTTEGLDDVPSGTTIPVDATTDWDDADGGVWVLIKDVGTLANSELAFLVGWSDGVSYTQAGSVVGTFDAADELYDGVDFIDVLLPEGTDTYRVDFYNTHGTATYAVKVDYEAVLDIE
jgi:hypothetical protein